MPKPRPRKPAAKKPKVHKAADALKIPGTFDQLIAKSLTAKKPVGGWPKTRGHLNK